MELFLVFFGIIFFSIFIKILFTGTKRASFIKDEPIPDQLDIQSESLLPIIQGLEKSLPQGYRENIKNRVLKEHPQWKDHEYEWAFFELKRYFLLNSLLKSIPMFSDKVDEIWHEMLMFTREYGQFSQDFFGEYLHHAPNLESTPIPGERAFFDWMYLTLFKPGYNSRRIWGGFLKNPIKKDILEDFNNKSEEDLLDTYFRSGSQWMDIKKELIGKLKNEISEAEQITLGNKFVKPSSVSQYSYLLLPAVYYSIYDSESYDDHMDELLPAEWAKSGAAGGVSCSGYACSSPTDHDSGGGNDSGGGSSCSSCGGGCSS
ncbi:hypothetical protein [Cytobacillus sp. NCCP-133]|uniref:hypothetical protein n=1 Tax=Cytobacillus sp. NCCP-133 TaxID=766848 RepID=UPI0022307EE0|nr:hypothetical protein [Cytobacillus sp. NCCP-133]GLB60736.1 hypothetical protein NCCP133_28680 [Cytobacillus sp. NCCP-133]